MQAQFIVYALTGVAALIAFTSRFRWRVISTRPPQGRASYGKPSGMVRAYAAAAGLACSLWFVFLIFPGQTSVGSLVGVIGLFFWWITALLGLRFAVKRPPRGADFSTRSQRAGLGLVLATLTLVAIVSYFTWAYTTVVV
ncbi:MAG: hypothetical protein ACRCYQ_07360 [Nocardioides sp.]